MEPTGKRRSFMGLIGEAEASLRDMFLARPRAIWADIREKMKDLGKTNFELGQRFFNEGKWTDAIFRFRVTLYFKPDYPHVLYYLGSAYFRAGKRPQAIAALKKALVQQPGEQSIIFMLSALDPASVPVNLRPQRMPKDLVMQFFANLAPNYDAMELRNQYQAGRVVQEQVKSLVPLRDLVVVDLACGTGIASRPWRAQSKQVIGVDFTPAMEAAAASVTIHNQKLFDRVIDADITALADAVPVGEANLVLLVNAAQFIGELSGTVAGAARLLKQEGILAMTVEPYSGGAYGLKEQTGHFGHSAAYVKQVAVAAGLSFVKEARVYLYPSQGSELFIFSKGAV